MFDLKIPSKKLRLERCRTAGSFRREESLFWEREINQIFGLLEHHVHDLSSNYTRNGSRPILSIGIFGNHGCGKSSVLKTLIDCIRKGWSEWKNRQFSNEVHCLPIITPNLQDEHDHILYALLAAALEDDQTRTKTRDEQSRESAVLSELQQAIQNISEYLQVVDPSQGIQENDPLGISLERLDRHSSSRLLQEKVGSLVDVMANTLARNSSSSFVLMPVDDADATMRSLTRTLDTYHRYLEHPRLVPMFTFNGQLAEELLSMHVAGELTRGTQLEPKALLEIAENKALQDLAKLFPARNRIRLGPEAAARVLGAKYSLNQHSVVKDENGTEKEVKKRRNLQILKMLQSASNLLYGCSEYPEESLRKPFKPAMLRRQIQIVDSMDAAEIGKWALDLESCQKGTRDYPREYPTDWIKFFEKSAWALLDLHRDTLRAFELSFDDILGWTPVTLRRSVLDKILSQDIEVRRELLTRWRFSVDDLRSQVLSLLAVVVFRPRMEDEDPWGDDSDALAAYYAAKSNASGEGDRLEAAGRRKRLSRIVQLNEKREKILAKRSLLWFLDLWMGFYLPQLLVRDRQFVSLTKPRDPRDESGFCPEGDRVTGIGWQQGNAPSRALRLALNNRDIFSPGMLLIDPNRFAALMNFEEEEDDEKEEVLSRIRLFLHIWCCYGVESGIPWAAVSFWRGLGLVGRLLSENERLEDLLVLKQKGVETDDPSEVRSYKRFVLWKVFAQHCRSARIPGSSHWNTAASERRWQACFDRWSEFPADREALEDLTEEVIDWLEVKKEGEAAEKDLQPGEGDRQRQEIVRRLHGDFMVGRFWMELERAYFELPNQKWDALKALEFWTRTLREYWSEYRGAYRAHNDAVPGIIQLLDFCPIPLASEFYHREGRDSEEFNKRFSELLTSHAEQLTAWKNQSQRQQKKGNKAKQEEKPPFPILNLKGLIQEILSYLPRVAHKDTPFALAPGDPVQECEDHSGDQQ